MPDDFTYMWNLKNQNKQTNRTETDSMTQRTSDGCQIGGVAEVLGEKGEGIKKYKLVVTE